MNEKLVNMIEDCGLEVEDVANIIREAQSMAVMTFVNNIVGAFESGFIDNHESTLADLYQCAVNHVKDNYNQSVPMLKEVWGEQLAELCRVGDAACELVDVKKESLSPSDTEILNFLDRLNKDQNVRYNSNYGWQVDVNHNRVSLNDMGRPGRDIRTAIVDSMLSLAINKEH
ncbi:hypothetical protein [Vibrio parahaemolyticus]|uniref:hypothetical protein n=1 Tax=Vibrio parahaemolyticus TaxID=670 RepID=UPI00177EEB6F|nr:hypothetical protein [Vibrio parahaemolyticus]MBD6945725.1 hypothetical protein [Vibrio parahaemolyticus]MBD6979005.1 hypothetical protein [Vibrio parahaemolyticus]MBD6991779.1 hypothetical protein [Vibrio parahaemolyticus]